MNYTRGTECSTLYAKYGDEKTDRDDREAFMPHQRYHGKTVIVVGSWLRSCMFRDRRRVNVVVKEWIPGDGDMETGERAELIWRNELLSSLLMES